jgi:hypothetical protein
MSNLINTNAGVAVAFWLCVAAVIVAAIVASFLKRRAGLATIRLAIERGQQLDEHTVRALLLGQVGSKKSEPQKLRQGLMIHGSVHGALGVGFVLFGLVVFGHPHPIFIGIGILLLCLGTGLLLASRMIGRSAEPKAE